MESTSFRANLTLGGLVALTTAGAYAATKGTRVCTIVTLATLIISTAFAIDDASYDTSAQVK